MEFKGDMIDDAEELAIWVMVEAILLIPLLVLVATEKTWVLLEISPPFMMFKWIIFLEIGVFGDDGVGTGAVVF